MKHVRMAAIVLAALVSATSCDKDDNNTPSTLSRIQAKWSVQSYSLDFPGTGYDSTYNGVATDYVDFCTDNKVYSQVGTEKDTLVYSLINNSTLLIDGDTSKISQLSGSQLVITKTVIEEGDTSKVTYNLKK